MAVLPPAYVDVPAALASRGFVCVIGIVVDVLPLFKTDGTSACITFTIKDCDLDNGHTWDGLKIRYFNNNENYLPQIQLKDVVLLRKINIRPFNGRSTAVARQQETVPWAVFRPELDPTSALSAMTGPVPFEPSYSEKKYAQSLLDRVSSHITIQGQLPHTHAQTSHVVQASPSNTKRPGQRPSLLVKDVQERMFVDLLGEIVKARYNDFDKAILYITDYTANQDLVDYAQNDASRDGDQYGYMSASKNWPGPVGRMTLQVTLWEPHASHARQYLKQKDLVRLTNVHMKRGRDAGNLEASVHTDRFYPEKIHVKAVPDKADGRVRDLLRRRQQYWKEHGGNPNEETKAPKKSKNQQRKKQEARRDEDQTSLQPRPVPSRRIRPNKHIQAIHAEIPDRSLEDIISNESHNNTSPANIKYRLPFQNLCYRAYVRVVDFFPPSLEDFSVPLNGPPAIFSSSAENGGDPDDPVRWEWRFCLLLESGSPPPQGQSKERIKLFVSGYDAEYLLKIDAVDLRRNQRALEELREKLFILWGDLEERKRKAVAEGEPNSQPVASVSSVPFICCIKEYGVKCTHEHDPDQMQIDDGDCGFDGCYGWERRFAMFETVIHS